MTRTAPKGRAGNSTPPANGHAIDFDAIRSRIDFRTLVEHELGISLDRDGRGCCPFHGGDNPTAFRVGERSAKCFACDWSGDVFDFYATLHPECDGPLGAAKVLGQLPQAKAKAKGKAAGGSSRGKAYKSLQEALEAAQRLPWGRGEGRLGKAACLYAYPAAMGGPPSSSNRSCVAPEILRTPSPAMRAARRYTSGRSSTRLHRPMKSVTTRSSS